MSRSEKTESRSCPVTDVPPSELMVSRSLTLKGRILMLLALDRPTIDAFSISPWCIQDPLARESVRAARRSVTTASKERGDATMAGTMVLKHNHQRHLKKGILKHKICKGASQKRVKSCVLEAPSVLAGIILLKKVASEKFRQASFIPYEG